MRRLSLSVLNKVRKDSDRMLPDALNHMTKTVRPFPQCPVESCRTLAINLRQTLISFSQIHESFAKRGLTNYLDSRRLQA